MSVTKEIIKYLITNPNPSDDELHKWAEGKGFNIHEVETIIYRLASRYVHHKDRIPGGKADKKKPEDYDQEQIKMGTKVEMEHTDNPKIAKEIAMDHLEEIPDYYTRLANMEKEAKKIAESSNPGKDTTLPDTDMSVDKSYKGTNKTFPGNNNMTKIAPVSDNRNMIKMSSALTKAKINHIITKDGILISAGNKTFYQQDGIGNAKYTINFHDGNKKHKDGSKFYDIKILKNKKDLENFKKDLLKKGYKETGIYGSIVSGQEKEATFYKKFKELEYWTSRNTSTRVACDNIAKAKSIIKNSSVKQKLTIG